jgi:hypothetical protein
VRQILDKYNQALPEVPANNEFSRIIIIVGERLPSLNASVVKQITYNRELKQVKMKKYEFLQTYTASHSFISNEYLRGTDPIVIMAMATRGTSPLCATSTYRGRQFADRLEQIWSERG